MIPSEWYAAVPGTIGDPIDFRLLEAGDDPGQLAAIERAREVADATGKPCRVVRIVEVAVTR